MPFVQVSDSSRGSLSSILSFVSGAKFHSSKIIVLITKNKTPVLLSLVIASRERLEKKWTSGLINLLAHLSPNQRFLWNFNDEFRANTWQFSKQLFDVNHKTCLISLLWAEIIQAKNSQVRWCRLCCGAGVTKMLQTESFIGKTVQTPTSYF